MLTRIQVKNYRSLEDIDIPIGPINAIVGPNGVGKTAILRALDLVLGDIWPSLRSFRIPQDFTGFDATRSIEITVWFDPPYSHKDMVGKIHEVHAIRVTCKPYLRKTKKSEVGDLHVDLDPLLKDGEVPLVASTPPQEGKKPQFRPLTVGNDLRDFARLLFIDHRRGITQHLPSMRGSILGKLLQKARKEFSEQESFKNAYDNAMDLLRTETVKEIELKIKETAMRMLGFLGSKITKSVNIGFGFTDPSNPFNSLRIQYEESGLIVPGEELGLGIQSAIVVGIFEAFRELGGEFETIIIEEPEMYLHPQAQRYFNRLLNEISDKGQCQVIYSTHSPIFADVNKFESLRLIRRKSGSYSSISYIPASNYRALSDTREKLKLGGHFNTSRNEVLFANQALLVEGYGDRNAALIVSDKLGFDVDAEGIAIVDCGGKAGIVLVGMICQMLSIPYLILHDDDIWPIAEASDPKKQEEENHKASILNERIKNAITDDNKLFIISPTLEEMLGIGRSANDKPRRIVEALSDKNINDIPKQLVSAIQLLMEESRHTFDKQEEKDSMACDEEF